MLEKKILSAKLSPEISLDPQGKIKITGRSMQGNEIEFTHEISDWIDEYILNPAELTSVDFHLEYFNAVNCKFYFCILKKIISLKSINKKFNINWYYEEGDEDILEKGEYMSELLESPFNYIMIDDSILSEN
jgi:hypothetical protein